MSAATSSGLRPFFASSDASLAAVVVLPEPWSPTIITTVAPYGAYTRSLSTGPMRASISSWQILTKWSPADTRMTSPDSLSLARSDTTSPMAFSRTRSMKVRVTLRLTSASSSERRMSSIASLTFSSVSSALPWNLFLTERKPLDSASSINAPPALVATAPW